MSHPFAVVSAASVPADALRDAFNASFADYLLSFPTMDATMWQSFVRRQGCDLALSFAALSGNVVLSFALITPRPERRTRIAVMGARPSARGTGVAARLLDDAIAAASARGDRWIELEAFAQNERAVRLYRSRGMEPVDALIGFAAEPGTGVSAPCAMHEVMREEAARFAGAIDRERPDYLPWQAGGEAITRLPGDVRAWHFGSAQLVFQESETMATAVSLLDRDASFGDALDLVKTLRHAFPDRTLRAPQLHREHGAAIAFIAAGWERQPLHQLFLRRQLS